MADEEAEGVGLPQKGLNMSKLKIKIFKNCNKNFFSSY